MPGTLAVSSEYALLLDALAPEADRRVPRASRPLEWDDVLRLAAWHRLEPLLYRHLAAGAQAPDDVLGAVESAYLANAASSLRLRCALERVLAALEAACVPAVLLKGAALIDAVYPDPALREMTDLDILVPAPALDAASGALVGIGYGPAYPADGAWGTKAWMRVHHHHDPPLIDPGRLAPVELHHHILCRDQRGGLDIDDVWRRARPAAAGARLRPAAEDLLLHACLHFMFNRTGRSDGSLAQVADIAWILDREEIDWPALTAIARACGLHARVFLALFAAHELGIPVPPGPLRALRPAGFDPALGRRLVALRVLRSGPSLPVRSLRTMVAPGRDCLARGWAADPHRLISLSRGYARRAWAQLPLARSALSDPATVIQDYRLNGQIARLASRPVERPSLPAAGR